MRSKKNKLEFEKREAHSFIGSFLFSYLDLTTIQKSIVPPYYSLGIFLFPKVFHGVSTLTQIFQVMTEKYAR